MPHPQQHEIEEHVAKLLEDDSRSFEVVSVDPAQEATPAAVTDSVDFLYVVPEVYDEDVARDIESRPPVEPKSVEDAMRDLEDYLGTLPEAQPHLRVRLGSSEHRRAVAAKLGFDVKSRVVQNHLRRHVTEAYAFKRISTPQEGAAACLEWLQHASRVGDSWLWITDLQYDDWPDPLPRPAVWPPAG